ncbi:MAG: hypothetical protein Kow00120_02340 [Anaerolineae bacterium]
MKRLLWPLLIAALAACSPAGPTPTPTVARPPNLPAGAPISAENAGGLRQIAELKGHRLSVFALAFSPPCPEVASEDASGQDAVICTPFLASVSNDSARLWDLDTRSQRALLTEGGSVSNVFYSAAPPPDSANGPVRAGQVVTLHGEHAVEVWSAPGGALLRSFAGHTALVGAAALAPDGVTLALGGEDGRITLWDITTGVQRATLAGHDEPVIALSFAPDGALLASASADRTIRLWDPEDGAQAALLTDLAAPASTLAFAPDGTQLAAGTAQQVRVWDLNRDDDALDAVFHLALTTEWGAASSALDFAPDGALLALGGSLPDVTLWKIEENLQAKLAGHEAGVLALDFSPDASLIVTVGLDAPPRVWRLSDGREMATLGDGATPSAIARFAPDGRVIAVDVGGAIQLWGVP